jgi:hypothetical protein
MEKDNLKDVRNAFFSYKRSHPNLTASVSSFVAGWNARAAFEKEDEKEIPEVTLLIGGLTDKIYIKYNETSSEEDTTHECRLLSKGYGLEYCEKVIKVKPRIIKT